MQRMRYVQYGFPDLDLAPGATELVKVDLKGLFRLEKLAMYGTMREIRGHYWIKRSRLPRLDREEVARTYSTIRKYRRGKTIRFLPGRTTVEYQGKPAFVRTYLPSSVVYEPVDPLSYIRLLNVFCNREPQMARIGDGVSALFYASGMLGNVLLDVANVSVSLLLKNAGDVRVHLRSAVIGVGHWPSQEVTQTKTTKEGP